MKTNYHMHTTWCDGKAGVEEMAAAAAAMGFDAIGFSSHSMLPDDSEKWVLTPEKAPLYAADVRSAAKRHEGSLRILCGVEADYVPGASVPDRSAYAAIAPDYVIGSVHFVVAPDGALVPVDKSPASLAEGVSAHFGGDAEAFVRAYFAQQREMAGRFDFDVIGHPDLVRKFNSRMPCFDESAPWYAGELEATADAFAASGKLVEVNTGAIARGWLDDAYPSPAFRAMLRSRGVEFLLSSDAHSPDAIDCAFDRFSGAERFVEIPYCNARRN